MFRIHEKVLMRDTLVSVQDPGFCQCVRRSDPAGTIRLTRLRVRRGPIFNRISRAAETTGRVGLVV